MPVTIGFCGGSGISRYLFDIQNLAKVVKLIINPEQQNVGHKCLKPAGSAGGWFLWDYRRDI